MNAKTMEGLTGANTNMNMIKTPMRVFKEAERRGDTATMDRAMGYVTEFNSRAESYKTKAYEGMEEEAVEVREKEKAEREKAILENRREMEEQEAQIAASKEVPGDIVEVSEEGKVLSEKMQNQLPAGDAVLYTKTGEINKTEQGDLPAEHLSVSV